MPRPTVLIVARSGPLQKALADSLQEAGCKVGSAHIQQRTIDVHVKSIRQKLKHHSEIIETVRGLGYRLREPRTNAETLQ